MNKLEYLKQFHGIIGPIRKALGASNFNDESRDYLVGETGIKDLFELWCLGKELGLLPYEDIWTVVSTLKHSEDTNLSLSEEEFKIVMASHNNFHDYDYDQIPGYLYSKGYTGHQVRDFGRMFFKWIIENSEDEDLLQEFGF